MAKQRPTSRVYDTLIKRIEHPVHGPCLDMRGRNRGGWIGMQALIIPDENTIDRLCLMFTVTSQIVGDQAEVAVRTLDGIGEVLISTFAPIDDAQYKNKMVLVTDDPLMKAIAGVRDTKDHLLDLGDDWPNTHEENEYSLPIGYVQRTTLTRNPIDHGFGFHLGVRLREADGRAVPVIQDLSPTNMPERWFNLESDTQDRVLYIGCGGFVEMPDYAASGKMRRVFHTPDESPDFAPQKTDPQDRMARLLDQFERETGKDATELRELFGVNTGDPLGEVLSGLLLADIVARRGN